jgi:hypothetical protein
MAYKQASAYSLGISVRSDILYASYYDRPREFKAGEDVAHRVVVFSVEVTPQETSAVARSCRIVEERTGGHVLHFNQPGGKHTEVKLIQ